MHHNRGIVREFKQWLKRLFGVFSARDLENALANIGNAKDRDDYEWRLRKALMEQQK